MTKSTPLWFMGREITTFENSLEGIVSKRKDSRYRSGRSRNWVKCKEPSGTGSEAGSRRGLVKGALAMSVALLFLHLLCYRSP